MKIGGTPNKPTPPINHKATGGTLTLPAGYNYITIVRFCQVPNLGRKGRKTMINITFKEILEMVTEDGKPTGYAVILNEKTRLGYITLFPDGWHIEKELENGYETITTCKTFDEAKKKAKLALTTDMIITRGCHRLEYKTLVDEVKKYKLNSRISVISYLIGRYNYIDNDDLEMTWLLYKEGIIED